MATTLENCKEHWTNSLRILFVREHIVLPFVLPFADAYPTGLDFPLHQYYPQLVIRTFLRLLGLAEPCAPGCHETWQQIFFSTESMLWCALSQHSKTRAELGDRCTKLMQHNPTSCRIHRIQSKTELHSWLHSIKIRC